VNAAITHTKSCIFCFNFLTDEDIDVSIAYGNDITGDGYDDLRVCLSVNPASLDPVNPVEDIIGIVHGEYTGCVVC